jgi:hypothetical protein
VIRAAAADSAALGVRSRLLLDERRLAPGELDPVAARSRRSRVPCRRRGPAGEGGLVCVGGVRSRVGAASAFSTSADGWTAPPDDAMASPMSARPSSLLRPARSRRAAADAVGDEAQRVEAATAQVLLGQPGQPGGDLVERRLRAGRARVDPEVDPRREDVRIGDR